MDEVSSAPCLRLNSSAYALRCLGFGVNLAGSSKIAIGSGFARGFWTNCFTARISVTGVLSTESVHDQFVDEEVKSFSVLEDHLLGLHLKSWHSVVDLEEIFFPLSSFSDGESVEFMAVISEKIVEHVIHSVNLD